MPKIASIIFNRLTLIAVIRIILSTLKTAQHRAFIFFTSFAYLKISCHFVRQFMTIVTIQLFQSLLIYCNRKKIKRTLVAQKNSALFILEKLGYLHLATHTLYFFRAQRINFCKLMLMLTHIFINIDYFAFQTITFLTFFTKFGASFIFFALRTVFLSQFLIRQHLSTKAIFLIILNSNTFFFIRKQSKTRLANSKITTLIIINSRIKDRSIHATNITNILKIQIFKRFKTMTNRAALFGARRHSTLYTIHFITFTAY